MLLTAGTLYRLTYEPFVVQKLSKKFRHSTMYPEDRLADWRSQVQCTVVESSGLADSHVVGLWFLQFGDRM